MIPALLVLLLSGTPAAEPRAANHQATIDFIRKLQDPETGGFKVDAKAKPSLRATSGAVRSLAKLGAPIPQKEKASRYVLGCLDKTTGGFAEPGGQPDVTITSIGIMAASELGIPHKDYGSALTYLEKNARSFEEVRIAAAGVEAWGLKDGTVDLKPWIKLAEDFRKELATDTRAKIPSGLARDYGSVTALTLRLGYKLTPEQESTAKSILQSGQRADGGWEKKEAKESDLETTYRVMRSLYLLKAKPENPVALRKFLNAHKNADGGYGMKPGDPSTLSGVYYAVMIGNWLDQMEK